MASQRDGPEPHVPDSSKSGSKQLVRSEQPPQSRIENPPSQLSLSATDLTSSAQWQLRRDAAMGGEVAIRNAAQPKEHKRVFARVSVQMELDSPPLQQPLTSVSSDEVAAALVGSSQVNPAIPYDSDFVTHDLDLGVGEEIAPASIPAQEKPRERQKQAVLAPKDIILFIPPTGFASSKLPERRLEPHETREEASEPREVADSLRKENIRMLDEFQKKLTGIAQNIEDFSTVSSQIINETANPKSKRQRKSEKDSKENRKAKYGSLFSNLGVSVEKPPQLLQSARKLPIPKPGSTSRDNLTSVTNENNANESEDSDPSTSRHPPVAFAAPQRSIPRPKPSTSNSAVTMDFVTKSVATRGVATPPRPTNRALSPPVQSSIADPNSRIPENSYYGFNLPLSNLPLTRNAQCNPSENAYEVGDDDIGISYDADGPLDWRD